MPPRRDPRVTPATREIARTAPGPTFSADLICLGCGWQGSVTYTDPVENFRCPSCKRRKAIRADEHDRRFPDFLGSRA